MAHPEITTLISELLNICWLIRNYQRGARQPTTRAALLRAQAIQKLGVTLKQALETSDDYEAILRALVVGLKDDDPPF